MNKIGFVVILFVISSVPVVLGHPDTMKAKITYDDGHLMDYTLIGLGEKDKDEPVELFSSEWGWKNFIFLLSSSIVVIMGVTITIVHRQD